MKKVLYLSNIEVPYRTVFFNQLNERCDLTVLYERRISSSRDLKWTQSQKKLYKSEYLQGHNISSENAFSFRIVKWLLRDFDCYIIGCFNSPVQILAIHILKILGKKIIISHDGENFLPEGIKSKLKKYIFSLADIILAPGKKSAEIFRELFPETPVFSYFFSSLTEDEIKSNSETNGNRNDDIIVVGQYLPCKGLDIVVNLASKFPQQRFKFIGTGSRTSLFVEEQNTSSFPNVEVVPFMDKQLLSNEYRHCRAMILPSRNECWGLVINEAASFGTPIISTYGSGAAVEFLSDDYSMFLAKYRGEKDSDVDSLAEILLYFIEYYDEAGYSDFLKRKSREYNIEKMVSTHLDAIHALVYESPCCQ